ncbi:hypothetical protein MTR67_044048 [Solanum verrucosum]|uniref:Uncharacterized protein n=1 Tax=Solanum verrucosum TaxID=315347 RepID=A0AAF0UPV3_SOLVR|nr:hypothetical protein MTR67_044048 [Solanum verrucosum]
MRYLKHSILHKQVVIIEVSVQPLWFFNVAIISLLRSEMLMHCAKKNFNVNCKGEYVRSINCHYRKFLKFNYLMFGGLILWDLFVAHFGTIPIGLARFMMLFGRITRHSGPLLVCLLTSYFLGRLVIYRLN